MSEKLNLRIPVLYFKGTPVKQPDNEVMLLGELLSQLIGSAPSLPENKWDWQFVLSRELSTCKGKDGTGIFEFDPDEITEILKMLPSMNAMPWMKGPLRWLLGKKVEDEKVLAGYHEIYGEPPHEKVGGLAASFYTGSDSSKSPANGTGERSEAGTGDAREEASSSIPKETLSTKDELEN